MPPSGGPIRWAFEMGAPRWPPNPHCSRRPGGAVAPLWNGLVSWGPETAGCSDGGPETAGCSDGGPEMAGCSDGGPEMAPKPPKCSQRPGGAVALLWDGERRAGGEHAKIAVLGALQWGRGGARSLPGERAPQEAARESPGVLAVAEQHLAADDGGADA